MAKKVLGFIVLILAMTAALVAYSMTATAPNIPGVPENLSAKVKKAAAPVLQEVGIDVEQIPSVDDLNIVEKQMENASDKIDAATNVLGGQ